MIEEIQKKITEIVKNSLASHINENGIVAEKIAEDLVNEGLTLMPDIDGNEDAERLFNVLNNISEGLESGFALYFTDGESEVIAEHILADGWRRLPCEIGETIYYLDKNTGNIEEDEVKFFTITKEGITPILKWHNKNFWKMHKWEETVFRTRKEAEDKVKENSKRKEYNLRKLMEVLE